MEAWSEDVRWRWQRGVAQCCGNHDSDCVVVPFVFVHTNIFVDLLYVFWIEMSTFASAEGQRDGTL